MIACSVAAAALSILNAKDNIMAAEAIVAIGFATFFPAFSRSLVRYFLNASDFFSGIDLSVESSLAPVQQLLYTFGFPEIDTAGQFTNDEDVDPLNHLALQCGGIRQYRIQLRRA